MSTRRRLSVAGKTKSRIKKTRALSKDEVPDASSTVNNSSAGTLYIQNWNKNFACWFHWAYFLFCFTSVSIYLRLMCLMWCCSRVSRASHNRRRVSRNRRRVSHNQHGLGGIQRRRTVIAQSWKCNEFAASLICAREDLAAYEYYYAARTCGWSREMSEFRTWEEKKRDRGIFFLQALATLSFICSSCLHCLSGWWHRRMLRRYCDS